jgi:cytochrome c-type biogenesis protein CcmH/NrfG
MSELETIAKLMTGLSGAGWSGVAAIIIFMFVGLYAYLQFGRYKIEKIKEDNDRRSNEAQSDNDTGTDTKHEAAEQEIEEILKNQ